jgi:DNA-directed RNA polymerase specialized sigma24 family protein
MVQLTEFTKGRIMALREEGFTYKEISEKTKIPLSTIGLVI